MTDWGGSKVSSRGTFLIDPSGKVARGFPSVKPTGHREEVFAALYELGATKQAKSGPGCGFRGTA